MINTIKDCMKGPYEKYLPKAKAGIAKYEKIHGVASTLHHHAKDFPSLKEKYNKNMEKLV